ncbi:carboxylesterase/lipase family protein [Hymenobacter armeniacus]|uniref:Carboxylic ester hydrolase n=1 Tax=Hymenobacter armeniacus TaxID=2771358 RepID=A0ABR8JTB3_9BACT|nr:carboxylesterase family protein [Hymenobacter armeniacus]MBD2723098.1 carboxylesterase family protein [Hymenobacter armeniacus]
MRAHFFSLIFLVTLLPSGVKAGHSRPVGALAGPRATTAHGVVEGTAESSGIRSFKGVPYAQPPVGALRWREPQPPKSWTGVRQAKAFGPRAMQLPEYADMVFRAAGTSEDCLYLNVWTPAKSARERLPVLVYFYGGGFRTGDGSEPRYDGEQMARQGIVAVTVNYRLGVFGFLAHPELTRESPHHSSGNYGLLDQAAALRWVRQNIAAFGGDPARVTIAGESAGSISVSLQLASPLNEGLVAGAIGESGAAFASFLAPVPLAKAEAAGEGFASGVGAPSVAALRALPAERLLAAAGPGRHFPSTIDGYFLPQSPAVIYAAGQQARVPLLAGWNSEEMNYKTLLGSEPPTVAGYENAVRRAYGPAAEEVLEAYLATSAAAVVTAATDLAGDRFMGYSTWKWLELHRQTAGQPVYRYLFARARPELVASGQQTPGPRGAVHSAEIEYALGNLPLNKAYAWTPEDYQVSKTMQAYFVNFIKTGNPNGAGLLAWPALEKTSPVPVLRLDVRPVVEPEPHRNRYLLLDKLQTP